jgi:hypothetical protein
VARRVPGAGHEDAWHSDAVDGRLAALTVNLSRERYEGGVLQIRAEPGGKIAYELANTGPGDAVIFKIDPRLKHRVTAPEGHAARTAFAGWFVTDPVRRTLGLTAAASASAAFSSSLRRHRAPNEIFASGSWRRLLA